MSGSSGPEVAEIPEALEPRQVIAEQVGEVFHVGVVVSVRLALVKYLLER